MNKQSFGFVIDANVFIKLLVEEHDSNVAEAFFLSSNLVGYEFFVPSLFIYEVVSIATKANVDIQVVLGLIQQYQSVNLQVIDPTLNDWQLAFNICQDGNAKTGYPSMYDSIYQAMAIHKNIPFITADTHHIAKAQTHGNIHLLQNWQALFQSGLTS